MWPCFINLNIHNEVYGAWVRIDNVLGLDNVTMKGFFSACSLDSMGTQLSIVSNILLLIRPLTNLSAFLLLYMIYICSTRVLFKREVADSKFKILHCWMHFFVLLIAQGLNHWWKLRFDPRWRPVSFWSCQVVAVPDLFLTAVKLSHDKTGAQYLHAARDDSNNLFRLVEIFFSGTKNFSLCGGKLEHSHAVWSWFWKKKKNFMKNIMLAAVFQCSVQDDPDG